MIIDVIIVLYFLEGFVYKGCRKAQSNYVFDVLVPLFYFEENNLTLYAAALYSSFSPLVNIPDKI